MPADAALLLLIAPASSTLRGTHPAKAGDHPVPPTVMFATEK